MGTLDCDEPELERVGDTWSHTFDLVCDEPTSIGPQEWIDDPERSLVWSGVTWNAAAGWYSFDLAASAEAYITIQACDNPEAVYVWTYEPQKDAYLAGGRYLVSGEAYIDTSPTATISARPAWSSARTSTKRAKPAVELRRLPAVPPAPGDTARGHPPLHRRTGVRPRRMGRRARGHP